MYSIRPNSEQIATDAGERFHGPERDVRAQMCDPACSHAYRSHVAKRPSPYRSRMAVQRIFAKRSRSITLGHMMRSPIPPVVSNSSQHTVQSDTSSAYARPGNAEIWYRNAATSLSKTSATSQPDEETSHGVVIGDSPSLLATGSNDLRRFGRPNIR
jgi:hypothetical protein